MVFDQGDHNRNKQFGADVITETIVSAKAASITFIKSSERIKLSEWPCDHGCHFLWTIDLYFTT